MRRDKVGRKDDAKTTRKPGNSSRPPHREINKKEHEKPPILDAGGLIFTAICVSALYSGLKTAQEVTTESKTTIDPKKGQANNSGAEKNPNSPITPSAIPPAPTTTPPAPAPTNLIQRFFALWASPTPTKEDNTKTTAQTADASPKSVSFNEATQNNDKRDTKQSVSPQKTTEPAPPTSIHNQTNPSVNEPETVTARSILRSWFSFFSKDTQANKNNSPAPFAEVENTADAKSNPTTPTAGEKRGPEKNVSGEEDRKAKGAETKKSPEKLAKEAMKNLIDEEVDTRMAGIKIRDRTIRATELRKKTTEEVTAEFMQLRSIRDLNFMKLLENQIELLAVQEQRTSNAKSKAEKNNNAGSPQSYAELRLSRPLDLRSVRTMDKNELEQHNRDIQEKRRDKITNASKEAINTYLNSPQQALKREEERLAQLKESNNGLTSAASRAGPTVYNTRYTMPENGTEDGPQTGKRRLTKASDATGGMGKVLKEEGWIKTTRVNASRHGGPSPCAHAWREEIQAPQVRESGGKGKGGGGR